MLSPKTRVRFAPSPTGLLHVGNARTALYNWLFARHTGGDFLLRIEDTDVERSEARYEAQLIEDLRWLGMDWSEGPGSKDPEGKHPDNDGPHAPYRQSERLEIYREHTALLLEQGKAYRCFCTAAELEEERQLALGEHRAQVYSGKCRRLASHASKAKADAGEPFAVRLAIPDGPLRFHDIVRGEVEFSSETVSDPILVRSSGVPVYNYVVTVDDALMEITHVIRGDDHLSNTPKQVAIYQAFGWQLPEFAHLSTILGSDRERLSKRHGATSIGSFREMGFLPQALINYLVLLGWGAEGGTRETFTLDELAREFTLERVTASPAVFDWDKLSWLNRHYLKEAGPARTLPLAWSYFEARQWLPAQGAKAAAGQSAEQAAADGAIVAWAERLLTLFLPSVDRLEQLPDKAAILWKAEMASAEADPENAAILTSEAAQRVIRAFSRGLAEQSGPVTAETFKSLMSQVKAETGVKGKELFHPVRIMLTGTHSGPEFDKLIPLIEEGSALPLPTHIPSVRERVQAFQR